MIMDRSVIIIALIIAASIIMSAAIYSDTEDKKADALIAKACIEAGGEWSLNWHNQPSCHRGDKK